MKNDCCKIRKHNEWQNNSHFYGKGLVLSVSAISFLSTSQSDRKNLNEYKRKDVWLQKGVKQREKGGINSSQEIRTYIWTCARTATQRRVGGRTNVKSRR